MALTREKIKGMDYPQLLKACRKRGLSSKGNTQKLRWRLGGHIQANKETTKKAESEDDGPSPKRQKKSVADDLICPISRELPFDPVHAEDGQVYERESIQEYFATQRHSIVNSPVMGRMMGRHLLPAPHIKNVIETSIENGQITGDLADKWLEKATEKKEMEELLKRAEDGDVEDMLEVAINFDVGTAGFKKDMKKAFHWFAKARVAGSVLAMAKVGEYLIEGLGVQGDRQMGAYYLGKAEEKGSEMAAYSMGLYLVKGLFGFGADVTEAKRLLQKCLATGGADEWDLHEDDRKEAQKRLDELSSHDDEEGDEDENEQDSDEDDL